MNNINTIGKGEFVFNNIYYGFCLTYVYQLFLLKPLKIQEFGIFLNEAESIKLLWLLACTFITFGMAINYEKRRNFLSQSVNILLPVECYSLASLYPYHPLLAGMIIFIMVLLSIVYGVMLSKVRIKSNLLNCICRWLYGSRIIAALTMVMLLIVMGCNYVFEGSLMDHTQTENYYMDINTATISSSMEYVLKLQDEVWEQLALDERLEVMQIIAEIEANYLGLAYELEVDVKKMDEDHLGTYRHGAHQILINSDYLETCSSRECMDTLLHEAYHSYQESVCLMYQELDEQYRNLYLFYQVMKFEENQEHYVSSSDDQDVYYNQLIEKTAREYAEDGVPMYFQRIEEYNNSN